MLPTSGLATAASVHFSDIQSPGACSIPHSTDDLASITSIADLDKLSYAELEEVLQDERKLEVLMTACYGKQIKTMIERRELSKEYLLSMAKGNLDLKNVFERKKKQCFDKHEEWREMKEKLDSDVHTFLKFADAHNLQSCLDNMRVAVMEAEEETDYTADLFLAGKMLADDFTKKFIEKRSLYHKRRSKEERMALSVENPPF